VLSNLVQFILTILLFVSMIVLNFSIFKIPIVKYHREIAVISLAAGFSNYYLKFVMNSPLFFPIQLIVIIVLLTALMRFPIFYSFFMTIVGFIAFSLLDMIVSTTATKLKLTSFYLMVNDLKHFSIMHIITTLIYISVAWILFKLKIGFSFVISRFSGKHVLKMSNFLWCALLSSGIIIGQVLIHEFRMSSVNWFVLSLLTILLFVILIYAYIQNRSILKDRFGEDYFRRKKGGTDT
jgi:hypothetical protein